MKGSTGQNVTVRQGWRAGGPFFSFLPFNSVRKDGGRKTREVALTYEEERAEVRNKKIGRADFNEGRKGGEGWGRGGEGYQSGC